MGINFWIFGSGMCRNPPPPSTESLSKQLRLDFPFQTRDQ